MNRANVRAFKIILQRVRLGGFILKTHQMFSDHTTLQEFKNATITDHFGFHFKENSIREIT